MRGAFAVVLLIALGALACAEEEAVPEAAQPVQVAEEEPISVYAVNYPLQYFAQRIGGPRVEVDYPGPADEDPAYWFPGPEAILAFQGADLILLNGADYARWISRVTLPEARMVDTSADFRGRLIPLTEGPVHSHGPEGEHSHTGYAFTTWLDHALAIEHARAVRDALAERRPADSEAFEANLAQLESDLEGVAGHWEAVAEALDGQPVLFSHPVYQYPVRRWELDAASVHFEPGEAQDGEAWQQLEALLGRHPARWMIWEAEPLPETAERLQALGVESVVLRPNATEPAEGDPIQAWMADLKAIEAALRAAS
jgi:zinc transport system substrate-binding protein